eukprot:gene5916-7309_t
MNIIENSLKEEHEISSALIKQNESLSAQLLIVQRETSVEALRRRIDHLRHALQQTQDLLIVAQVKQKLVNISSNLHMDAPIYQQLCRLCMEHCVSVVADPCEHTCSCRSCAVTTNLCPVCSQNVTKYIVLQLHVK